jgi:TatD DNase family protein
MLIDTHCHLDASEFDPDRDEVVQRALQAGVACMVVPAVEAGNFEVVQHLARRHGSLRYALGIHPLYVDRAQEHDLATLRQAIESALADDAFVAVGEIGLDGFVPVADPARHEHFFVEQLRLAREFDLPVICHVRRAQDRVLKHLRRMRVRSGVAHAFNGSVQQAEQFIGLGFVLGFGGAMTFDRALQIRRLAAAFDDSVYVLETDAPDIAPAWHWQARNAPVELPRIAEVFAELRGQSPQWVATQTGTNAARALPRLTGRSTG